MFLSVIICLYSNITTKTFIEYGSAQMMPLPCDDFFWHENPKQFMKENNWKNWNHDSEFGYFLEVL